jgi:hypothetical protein
MKARLAKRKRFFLEATSFHQWQGCQMLYFQTKFTNLDKFGRAFEWKLLVYFIKILNISCPFLYFLTFGNFVVIWYIFPTFGILYQENLAALICGENYRRDVELSTSKLPTVKMVT